MPFLHSRQAPTVPLELPKPGEIILPIGSIVKNRRLVKEAFDASSEAADIVQSQPAWLVSRSITTAKALAAAIPLDLRVEKERLVTGMTVGLGYALAAVESRRGWHLPKKVDGRIHTAMAFAVPQFPDDLARIHFALMFVLQAGYWVSRTGDRGLKALLAQPDLAVIRPEP